MRQLRATKCVVQPYSGGGLDSILDECLTLTYNAIEYGERNGVTNRKGMKGFYQTLRKEKIPSCYKVGAITRACSLLESRKKGEKRRILTRNKKPLRPMICIISGFFITARGRLFIPLRRDRYFDVQLNQHVIQTLEGKKKELRSLTMTPDSLSLCYSQDVKERGIRAVFGVDRNEKNITFGNADGVVQIDVGKAVRIKQTTREILSAFRRDDMRVRRKLASRYWKRCTERTNQMLNDSTNFIIEITKRNNAALALKDITDIRRMYRKRNGQGTDYRFRLNSWPHWKARKMLEYKSAWGGVRMISLTKSETYGSSSMCSACGERLHNPVRGDVAHKRQLWCQKCKAWTDRDVNAALNLSARGLARFASSRPTRKPVARNKLLAPEGEEGLACEAVKGNPEGRRQQVILRVDASKMRHGRCSPMYFPKTHQNQSASLIWAGATGGLG